MKQRLLMLAIAAIAVCLQTRADVYFDFKAAGNHTYHIRIPDVSGTQCYISTTEKGAANTCNGSVDLPITATYNGKTYTVVGVDEKAFYLNKKITSLQIRSNYKTIGANAFNGCEKLSQLVILNNGVEELGDGAFAWCTSLVDVTLPEGVKKIGPYCFYGTNINSISIPVTVQQIGDAALASFKLTEIKLPNGSHYFRLENGILYTNTYNAKLVCCPAKLSQVGRETYSFGGETGLLVDVIDGTEEIMKNAFFACDVMRVNIPESVTKLGEAIFLNVQKPVSVFVEWEGKSLSRLSMPNLAQVAWPDVSKKYDVSKYRIHVPLGQKSAYQNLAAWKGWTIGEWDVPIRDFTIGGETVLRSKLAGYATSGTISYDRTDKILTLNKATINQPGKDGFSFTGNDEIEVEVYGKNNIMCGRTALRTSGSVSLLVDGMDNDANLYISNQSDNASAYANKSVRISERSSVTFSDLYVNMAGVQTPVVSSDDDGGQSQMVFYNCDAYIRAATSGSTRPVVAELKDLILLECYIDNPAGAYYDTEESALLDASGKYQTGPVSIKPGRLDTYDVTINGQQLTSAYTPCLKKGTVTYNKDNGKITLKNAVIESPGDGLFCPEGFWLELIGDNSITAKGNALVGLENDNTIEGTGKLYVYSSEGYGISIEEMLQTYDKNGSPKLDVYGKLGALDGRRQWSNYFNKYVCGYLDNYDADITLRSDGNHAVVHDIDHIDEEYGSFIYDEYWFDEDQRTVVWGDGIPVTKDVRLVSKESIKWVAEAEGTYNGIAVMNNRFNNYNMDNFDPQSLRSGQITYKQTPFYDQLNLKDVKFDLREDADYEAIWTKGVETLVIYVDGKCDMPAWFGLVFQESSDKGASISLNGMDSQSHLWIQGGIYIEGVYNQSGLNISNLNLTVDDMCYIWSQDDCRLHIFNSTLDLNNDAYPDDNIMEFVDLSLDKCYIAEPAGAYWDTNKWRACNADGTPVKEHLLIKAGNPVGTGISNTPFTDNDASAPAYNLMGQRLMPTAGTANGSYRGLIIKGGKKLIAR